MYDMSQDIDRSSIVDEVFSDRQIYRLISLSFDQVTRFGTRSERCSVPEWGSAQDSVSDVYPSGPLAVFPSESIRLTGKLLTKKGELLLGDANSTRMLRISCFQLPLSFTTATVTGYRRLNASRLTRRLPLLDAL